MREPTFSIITVCLNAATTIRQTLASVRRQTYAAARIQHVVMDGGSTDGTQAILAEAHQAGHIAVWRSARDHGVYDAMNRGLALADGACVAFLNADDWYAPDALASVAAVWTQVQPDYLFCDAFQVDAQGLHPRLVPADFGHIVTGMPYCHQSLFCARLWLTRLGGFDTSFRVAGDYDLVWRLLAMGAKPCHLRRPLVFSRLGGLGQRVPHVHEIVRILGQHVPELRRLLQDADSNRYAARLARALVRARRRYPHADWSSLLRSGLALLQQIPSGPSGGQWRRALALCALRACARTPEHLPLWVLPLLRLALLGGSRMQVSLCCASCHSSQVEPVLSETEKKA